MSAVRSCRPSCRPSGSRTCSSRPCSLPPASPPTGTTSPWSPCSGLLGLRIFESTCADIDDLGEEHGHRVLRVCGKGSKVVLVPQPPAVGRAIDRAVSGRSAGPILLNNRGTRMDRHAATRRLRLLAGTAGVQIARTHPHMLRHTFVTTMLDAGVDLRDVQIAAAMPTLAPRCATTVLARTSTVTPTTSSPPTWPPAPEPHLTQSSCTMRDRADVRALLDELTRSRMGLRRQHLIRYRE